MENKNWLKKLFEKRKKGFTLIELLAIIVILAIIAVITVPIILNIIENAKKGAAVNSAYGYKDAISKFYASKLVRNPDYDIPDGLHTKTDFDTLGVAVKGKEPASNSFLRTYKNVVTSGCLQFDEYKVEFLDGKPLQATKGECKTVSVIYTDVNNNGKIDLADTVKIENDEFYIIDEPRDGKVKLLAKYNLNSNSRQENGNNVTVAYSSTKYWDNDLSNYNIDKYDSYYVYRKKNGQDTSNNIVSYIDNYKDYLIGLGAYFVTDGRMLSYAEAKDTGCRDASAANSCPTWASNQSYWLGSYENYNSLYFIRGATNTKDIYNRTHTADGWGEEPLGIRPLIEIYESAITNNYTITFDSRGGGDVPQRQIITGEKVGTLPDSLTKTNAVFEGWYTDKEYTTKISSDTIPVGSTTYYARYVLSKAEYTDSDGSGTINLGDYVKILDDEFYVISSPAGGKVNLIAKYNLNYNSRQENGHNALVAYSSTKYWDNALSNYNMDRYDKYYVYRNKSNGDTSNNIATYINKYRTYLNRQGAEFATDVRLLSYADVRNTGCQDASSANSCPTYVANQSYWLGSYENSNSLYYIRGETNTKDIYRRTHGATGWGEEPLGIRVLVEVDESALTNNYTIAFDSRGGTSVASRTIATGASVGTLPENPTKEGATFAGWYADTEYTTQISADTIPVGSTIYYAKYTLTKAEYTDLGDSGINLGDYVKIFDEEFYVIGTSDNNKVRLIAKYNLNYNSRQENGHNPLVAFSGTEYWKNALSNYNTDSYGKYYVYRNKSNGDTSNNIASYVNAYKDYLVGQGAEFVTDVRLLSYADAKDTGCQDASAANSCATFASNQSYWLGSYNNYDTVYFIRGATNTKDIYNRKYSADGWGDEPLGIRVLVEVNLSALQ